MALTGRFGLPYQTINDQPDGPNLGEDLALAVDTWLTRFYPVANAAARNALTGLVPEGFAVRQRDDASKWIYSDLGAWEQLGGSGGTGGGGTGGVVTPGEWTATSVQTFASSGSEYPVAFGNESRASAAVTRSAKGPGHKFSCVAGVYIVDCSVRFGAGSQGSRFIGLRTDDDVRNYVTAQNDGGPAAATRTFTRTIVLPATTVLYVVASQSSGDSLQTQASASGQNPSNYVSLGITKIG